MSNTAFFNSPLSKHQATQAQELIDSLDQLQLFWLSAYLSGLSKTNVNFQLTANTSAAVVVAEQASIVSKPQVLKILYGSHSGNSKDVAQKAFEAAQTLGIAAEIADLATYNVRELKNEKSLLIAISTYGEGEPPFEAEEFFNFLMSKKAPQLIGVNFAVIGLGDSSYKFFCKAGADIDARLAELGATRVSELTKGDIDYEETAKLWIDKVVPKFKSLSQQVQTGHLAPVVVAPAKEADATYSKRNPFSATVLDRIKLNGRGSKKETYHVELSLENSGLSYQPGDALGVYSYNNEPLVDSIIKQLKFDPESQVDVNSQAKSLRNALIHDYELTVLTPPIVKSFAEITKHKAVKDIADNDQLLNKYLYGRDILDLISEYPAELTPQSFTSVLRKLPPRLYSIASSQLVYPDEVHLTVGAVKFNKNERLREGVCSNFLTSHILENASVPVFIDKNENFRLPVDTDAPIILIGPGTGVAPYRAFLQHRQQTGAKGKNWLFFGDQHFTTDFLYQEEWLNYKKTGLLTNIDVAFSRDQNEKIYVQHKMYEKSRDIFKWIAEGAHIYICGDKNNMARDVKRTIYNIIAKETGFSEDIASEYFNNLKRTKRILEDVY